MMKTGEAACMKADKQSDGLCHEDGHAPDQDISQ
jgi:hypothetical protein